MKPPILFLDQQSWRAGAQRVLDEVLVTLEADFTLITAFPGDGPFAAELRRRGVNTLTYPLGYYRPGEKSLGDKLEFGARSLACVIDLARTIVQRKVRLVYINGPRCLPAGVMAARLTRVPSLFHLHRTLTRDSELLLAPRAASLATRIVACSRASADALLRARPKLAAITQVVYNPAKPLGVDEQRECVASLALHDFQLFGTPIVGLVGRFTPTKGLHVLLKAAALIRVRWPQMQVVMVGGPDPRDPDDASYVRALQCRAVDWGLKENVRWMSYHSNPGPFYARFDILALPSVDRGEGVPMVALEAMQRGVPVVASRVGGIPEVVHDGTNGLLVPPGDEQALAGALARILGDGELREKLKAGAITNLDARFSPATFRRCIRNIVHGLVYGPDRAEGATDRGEFAAQR